MDRCLLPLQRILQLALLLACTAVAAEPGPEAQTHAQTIARAEQLAASGAVDDARELWLVLQDAAVRGGDQDLQRRSRDALADLDFMQGRYVVYRQGQERRLQDARQAGDREETARALMRIAMLDRRIGELDAAQDGFERSLPLWRELGDRDSEALVLSHLSMVLIHKGDFTDALEALTRSLELQQQGATAELDRTYHYFGLLYRALQEYDLARDYLQRGLEIARTLPSPMRQAPLLGSLARVSNDAGWHAEALQYSEASNALSRQHGSLPGQAFDAMERGRALLGMGRHEEARAVLEDCVRLSRSIGQPGTAADAEFALARLALQEDRVDDALLLLDSALPIYIDAADLLQTLETYQLLVPLLRARGDLARALHMSEESLRLQRRMSSLQANRRIALLEYRRRGEDAERRIELLTRDNEIQRLRLRQASLTRQLGLIAFVALGLVMLSLALRYRATRRLATHLAAANAALGQSRFELGQAHAVLQARAEGLQLASITDELTGIANRRQLFVQLQRLQEAARCDGEPLAVMMIDIDHFKQVNDSQGHAVGDAVLVRTARTLQRLLPADALLGRLGGEEFLLLQPRMSLEQAQALAGVLCRAVAAENEGGPAVSISIGLAVLEPGDPEPARVLLDRADQALYRAKQEGRNRVEIAQA
jgi:diguanylate cyclase (GGDEF)-like protein